MMFSRYLSSAALIMQAIGNQDTLATQMTTLADQLRSAISSYGIVRDPKHGTVYAYEVDGYGSRNMMDDANIPSLLSAPFFGYLDMDDTVYQATRKILLSADNPYFMRGPVINAVGGPHDGPGYAWPMASIMRIFTSSDDTEIFNTLKEIVSSTDGLGTDTPTLQLILLCCHSSSKPLALKVTNSLHRSHSRKHQFFQPKRLDKAMVGI